VRNTPGPGAIPLYMIQVSRPGMEVSPAGATHYLRFNQRLMRSTTTPAAIADRTFSKNCSIGITSSSETRRIAPSKTYATALNCQLLLKSKNRHCTHVRVQ
jgi:hypothetical protein